MLHQRQIEEGFLKHYESPRMSHGFMGQIMGTRFNILIFNKCRGESEFIWEMIQHELIQLNNILNRFDPFSEVSKINRYASSTTIKVSDMLWSILEDCRNYYQKTDGIFDITINDFSALKMFSKDKGVLFLNPDLYIDFGGYAKGLAMKRVLNILLNDGVNNAFIDFGNSAIYGLGHHPYGDSWKVSIPNPFNKGEIVGEFELMNTALSTSGNSPNYCGHIVNPITSEKMIEKKMVCVESKDPLDAEVLSTTMMVVNSHQREKIINSFPVIQFKEIKL